MLLLLMVGKGCPIVALSALITTTVPRRIRRVCRVAAAVETLTEGDEELLLLLGRQTGKRCWVLKVDHWETSSTKGCWRGRCLRMAAVRYHHHLLLQRVSGTGARRIACMLLLLLLLLLKELLLSLGMLQWMLRRMVGVVGPEHLRVVSLLLLHKDLLLVLRHRHLLEMLVALMVQLELSMALQLIQPRQFLLIALLGIHLKVEMLLHVGLVPEVRVLLRCLHREQDLGRRGILG